MLFNNSKFQNLDINYESLTRKIQRTKEVMPKFEVLLFFFLILNKEAKGDIFVKNNKNSNDDIEKPLKSWVARSLTYGPQGSYSLVEKKLPKKQATFKRLNIQKKSLNFRFIEVTTYTSFTCKKVFFVLRLA